MNPATARGTNIAAAIASSDQPSFEYKEYAAAENAIAPSKQMACNQRGGVKCFVGETTGLLMLPNAVVSGCAAVKYQETLKPLEAVRLTT